MSDLHRTIVIETFATADDVIRAIQGLKVSGFDPDDVTIAGRDRDVTQRIADLVDVSVTDEWPDNGLDGQTDDLFRVVVKAGEQAAFARQVMVDGIVDATGFYADIDEDVTLDGDADIPGDDDYPV